ncbi:MAG: hypothetical protein JO191_14095 [Mycobacteriaceae bacterium]|nr:hypothetical protein [Mycobacteriaceae bacterium]
MRQTSPVGHADDPVAGSRVAAEAAAQQLMNAAPPAPGPGAGGLARVAIRPQQRC